AEFTQAPAPVRIVVGVVGNRRHGFLVDLQRFGFAVELPQSGRPVPVGYGILRIELQRLTVLVNRFLEAAKIAEGSTPIIVRWRAGPQLDGFGVLLDGFFVAV